MSSDGGSGVKPELSSSVIAMRADKARRAREWRAKNPDKNRRIVLKTMYGITPELYDALFAEQHGVCAICGHAAKGSRRLSVDHDHDTGAVRGLLCQQCNTGIGMLNDDLTLILKAHAYLARPR